MNTKKKTIRISIANEAKALLKELHNVDIEKEALKVAQEEARQNGIDPKDVNFKVVYKKGRKLPKNWFKNLGVSGRAPAE